MKNESNYILVTIEAYGKNMTLELPSDLDLAGWIEQFILILTFLSFTHDSIKEYFPDE